MKCPECDGEEHPKWKAHWFKPVDQVVAPAKSRFTSALSKDRHRPGYMKEFMRRKRAKEKARKKDVA